MTRGYPKTAYFRIRLPETMGFSVEELNKQYLPRSFDIAAIQIM